MNQLQIFDFENNSVRVIEIEGKPYFVGKDVTEILGYKNSSDALSRHVDEEDKLTSGITTSGQIRRMTVINESGLYSLILSSEIPSAKPFKLWVTSEVLPQIRKTGSYSIFTDEKKIAFETHLIGVKYTTEILRVDEPSKLRMLTEAHKAHGVPTNHLPAYVEEELKKSLTELLKEHGVKMSAAKANTRLIELGLLEFKERPSSKGGTKEFKSLTEAGRKYGDNAISPYNSKETQPLYYPSKFNELLGLLLEKEVS